jgi:heme-degrading monooxygenase HmoA
MIKRFVKLTFKPEHTQDFIELFNATKALIAAAEGCKHLELLHDVDNKNIFFTFSIWENTDYIDQYRDSELFKNVWTKTKVMFGDKPEAWSLKGI